MAAVCDDGGSASKRERRALSGQIVGRQAKCGRAAAAARTSPSEARASAARRAAVGGSGPRQRLSAVDEEVKRPRQQDELAGQIVGRQAMRAAAAAAQTSAARSSSAPSVLAKRSQRAMPTTHL